MPNPSLACPARHRRLHYPAPVCRPDLQSIHQTAPVRVFLPLCDLEYGNVPRLLIRTVSQALTGPPQSSAANPDFFAGFPAGPIRSTVFLRDGMYTVDERCWSAFLNLFGGRRQGKSGCCTRGSDNTIAAGRGSLIAVSVRDPG
jgi:hypothetical protein